jgi:hypothetical protein
MRPRILLRADWARFALRSIRTTLTGPEARTLQGLNRGDGILWASCSSADIRFSKGADERPQPPPPLNRIGGPFSFMKLPFRLPLGATGLWPRARRVRVATRRNHSSNADASRIRLSRGSVATQYP